MTPLRASIGGLLPWSAERFGDAAALTIPDERTLSFRELDGLAARAAGGLAALGVGRGDRVVLYLQNGWRWVVCYHAIARLGAIVVPANGLLTTPEVVFIVEDCGAVIVITSVSRTSDLEAAFETSPGSPDVKVVATGGPSGATPTFEGLIEGPPLGPADFSPDDVLAIGYTSGTTGRPKGAVLSHRCVFESAAMTATLHARTRDDVVLSALPLPHVYGNIVMNAALLSGARLIALARFEAGEVLRLIQSERVTLFEGVPTMYYQLLARPEVRIAGLSSLRRCTVGGQTMPVASLQEVVDTFGCPVLELWGMTEVAGPALTHSPYWPPRLGSIGLPFPGTEARIVGLSGEGPLPAGDIGELQVRGPLVMQGYWRDPAATAEAIDPDGWLSTGDIARRDDEGYVFIVDRRKDMILTAGYNVYPAELEQVIASHASVSMVAVGATPDREKGEIATAYVVKRSGATVTADELDAHCRAQLAAYKTPRRFVFVDDLPKTSTGKIMRRALRDAFPEPSTPGTPR